MVPDGSPRAPAIGGGRSDGRAGLGRDACLALRDQRGHGNGATKPRGRGRGRRGRPRGRGCDPAALGAHRQPIRLEGHDDGAVPVRTQDPGPRGGQPLKSDPRRVAVRIAGAGRRDRDPRLDRVHERLGRGRPAAVVGDLEEVDAWQAGGQQLRVDRLLHVAHQQESSGADLPNEHHRDVVDARSAVRRLRRHSTADRPEHAEIDLVDGEPIARGDPGSDGGIPAG